MSIGKKIKILNIILFVTIMTLIAVIALMVLNQNNLNDSYANRYESYLRADELRQSSDDLTRLARTFVITNDKKYEDEYWDILAIRGGKKARANGEKIALRDIMKNLGFTKKEFDKLKEAENNSNSLVTTETIAMNEVKGLYDDGNGNYNIKKEPNFEHARKIMFDDKYHADKKIIMDPISEFDNLLNIRTKSITERYKKRGNIYLSVICFLTLTLIGLIFLTTRSIKNILEKTMNEFDRTNIKTDEFTEKLLASSKKVANSTQKQSSSIDKTVSSLDQISALVSKSVDYANNSATKAEDSFEVARNGQSSVTQMISAIDEINKSTEAIMNQIDESNNAISNIAEVIKGIAQKTTIINDIVFQTKLLSFNASVEAARAGEHGKGFAVVAEEVGSLSQMSGDAAQDISDMLSESIKKVENVVDETKSKVEGLVETNKRNVSTGVNIANQCESSLAKVVENIKEMNTMANEISHQSKEQVIGINVIVEAINEIESQNTQNSSEAKNSENLSGELVTQSIEIGNLVNDLKNEVFGRNNYKKVS
jgi:methyl-accepting chemotaxis protein